MPLLPVNDHEAILEPFWNGDQNADGSRLDLLAPYRLAWLNGATGKVRPPACFTLATPATSGPALTLERDCDLQLDGYDCLVLAAALPANVRCTLLARLDGAWQTVLDAAPGTDRHDEYEGCFTGRHLTGLRLEFCLTDSTSAVVTLDWLLAADRADGARLLAHRPLFDPAWPGLLEPQPGPADPQLGLFFAAADLPALRAKVRSPHLAPHYQALLARAEQLLAIRPEELVGPYAPGGDPARGLRRRDAGRPWLAAGVADLLAFAGLLENQPRYSRHAARMALALAHCGQWLHSFVGALPGTTVHPRCFSESYILRAVALVLDWAGHCLTPAGRELLRDAMILKGLARVESDFRRWEYIRGMNQGLLFTPGRIHAYLALEKTYPRYRANLREAVRDLNAMLNHYLQADGGTLEGMGYWHSVGEIFPTLYALARRAGNPFAQSLPPRVRRTADYALAMLSTAGDGTTFLPINAAGHNQARPSLTTAAVLAQATDSDTWRHLYARLLADASAQPDWFHLLAAPTHLPRQHLPAMEFVDSATSSPPPPTQPPPAFYHFPATGHAGLHRPLPPLPPSPLGRGAGGEGANDGPPAVIRLHLFSGPSRGGHSHQDKGSFILEAAGETLAADRGTTNYNNPAHLLMGQAAWHNLTVPEDDCGNALEQQPKTTPGGRLVMAEFKDGILDLLCDNRHAWEPGLFTRNRRRIWSPAPDLFVIDDDLQLRTPHAVSFRLNSAFPIDQDATGGWIVTGSRCQLRILPVNWSPEAEQSRPAGIDCHGQPVNLLRLATAPARRHRLLTCLQVLPAPAKESAWKPHWHAARQLLELSSTLSQATCTYALAVTHHAN